MGKTLRPKNFLLDVWRWSLLLPFSSSCFLLLFFLLDGQTNVQGKIFERIEWNEFDRTCKVVFNSLHFEGSVLKGKVTNNLDVPIPGGTLTMETEGSGIMTLID